MKWMHHQMLRRGLVLGLGVAGFALLGAGIVFDRTSLAVGGLALWVLLLLAVTFGVRRRLVALFELGTEIRVDQDKARQSQLRLHERVAWLNRARVKDRERTLQVLQTQTSAVRENRRRHAVALAELQRLFAELVGEQHRELIQQRRAAEDGQTLSLRAFRETDTALAQLRLALERSSKWSEDALGAVHEDVRALSTQQSAFAQDLARVDVAAEQRCKRQTDSVEQMADRVANEVGVLAGSISKSLDAVAKAGSERAASGEATGKLIERVAGDVGLIKELDEKLRHIDKVTTTTSRALQKAQYEIVQEVEAMLYLQKLLALPAPAPLLGGWAMDPVAMLKLVSWVLEAKPKLIVECGSGASTVWLGHALRLNGAGKLISLDHQPKYADATREALILHGLGGVAEVLLAPIGDVQVGDQAYPWYSVAALQEISGIDMLIVDGPPGATGPLARYPALPVLAPALAPGALVVLDDAKREEEQKIMERWRREYPALGSGVEIAPRTRGFTWKRASE